MRSKIVKNIFKKEMLDILRDKKTIFMMIVVPILLYPIMMVAGTQIVSMSVKSIIEQDVNIAFNTKPNQEFLEILNNNPDEENSSTVQSGKVNIIEVKDYKKALENEEIDAYIKVEEKDSKTNYKIYTNSSKGEFNRVVDTLKEALNQYKENLIDKNLEKEGLDKQKILEPIAYETVDVAKNEEIAGSILGQVLPFILVIGVLLGAIYPAIDVMAGEKERGTLETLFTLPISNLELVMGKYMAVSFSAITTAFLNVLSIGLTMVFIVTSGGLAEQLGMGNIKLSSLVFPALMSVVCICLFAMVVSAVSMCVCSLARSFKDAQNYITPIMLLVMLPSYVSMIPNVELDKVTSIIPVVNISLLIKSVLLFKSDVGLIGMVLVSNIAFVILSVMLLSKMFNSEDILFGNSKSFSLLEKRSNIKKGSMPGVSDGITLYGVGLVLLIYVGSIVQMKFGMTGLAITQAMIIALPLLYAYYIKSDFKKLLSIKLPKIQDIVGGLIVWMGVFIAINIITQFLIYIFPQNIEVIEALNKTLLGEKNILINLLIVAVLPGICEEVFFRGFVFSAFRNDSNSKKSIGTAIIATGILFGFMHIDFLRIIPTSILGIVFTYFVYKTGSIFVPMFIHFVNNTVSILAGSYPNSNVVKGLGFIEVNFSHPNIGKLLILIALIIILVFVGLKILNIGNTSKIKEIKE